MKQIVPLIAVKMWCWNPHRFSKGRNHLHGFILRYMWWKNHNREGEEAHLHLFLFPIWFGAGIKEISMWLHFHGWQTGAEVPMKKPLFDLNLVHLHTQEVKYMNSMLPLKWPRFGTNHFIPMQDLRPDGEHHVWIAGEPSQKGGGWVGGVYWCVSVCVC